MGRRKIKWTNFAPLDEHYEREGDEPSGYPGWIECPNCDWPMPYYDEGMFGYFECSTCGLRIEGIDAGNDENWDGRQHLREKPAKCICCDGPYHDCVEHCVLVDL